MTAFQRFIRPSRRPLMISAVFLAALAFAGCRDLTGDELGKTGAVEVRVQDQAGAPLVNVIVEIARKNEVKTEETANNGVARFDLVEVGQRSYVVRNPSGYTGGGEANTKTVTVTEGQVTKSTFTLTKLP